MEKFDLWPSVGEVLAAKRTFLAYIEQHQTDTDYPPQVLISGALAEVWREGRRYQKDKVAQALEAPRC